MDIYSFKDYRDVLKHQIESEPQQWGYQTRLSEAAKCQKTYLSRVLKGTASLTPDQGFDIAQFWGLTEDETEFFMLLINMDRAGSKTYANYLKKKVQALGGRKRHLESRLDSAEKVQDPNTTIYYSAWFWSAIHIMVGMPGFQREEDIARKLNIPISLVRSALEILEALDLVGREKNGWVIRKMDIHIPDSNFAILPYHQAWRQKASEFHALRRDCDFFYTSVQSIAKKDLEKLRKQIFDAVQKMRKSVVDSPAQEELVAFNCDFFVL